MDRPLGLILVWLSLLLLPVSARTVRCEDSIPAPAIQRSSPRLVLDPGHGGADPGAHGRGRAEKDAALAVAEALAKRLEAQGIVVFLTRNRDQDLSKPLRAAFANYREADLYLALHFSGEPRVQARGFEVFVAPPPLPGLDPQRWEAGQARVWQQSRAWAEAVRRRLGEVAPTFDRGEGILPHPALEAVTCPAALVELGSLAWPDEAEWWRSPAGAEALSRALAAAVADVTGWKSP